jgi:hypothetical protein
MLPACVFKIESSILHLQGVCLVKMLQRLQFTGLDDMQPDMPSANLKAGQRKLLSLCLLTV